jgi:hypothetical protein
MGKQTTRLRRTFTSQFKGMRPPGREQLSSARSGGLPRPRARERTDTQSPRTSRRNFAM